MHKHPWGQLLQDSWLDIIIILFEGETVSLIEHLLQYYDNDNDGFNIAELTSLIPLTPTKNTRFLFFVGAREILGRPKLRTCNVRPSQY